jgi:hypothetical protein
MAIRQYCVGVALLAATLGAAPAAIGQTPPAVDTSVETARVYFEAGLTAMRRSDWTEALRAFDSSARLRRSASVMLNQGVCLHRLGRFAEARARLQEFMEAASPSQHQANDPQVGPLLAEIARRIGHVTFDELSPAGAEVTIDDRPVSLDGHRSALVDPGPHRLRVTMGGRVPHVAPLVVAEGAAVSLRVSLRPLSAAANPVASPHPDPRADLRSAASRPITSRWWFWTAIGAGVAAVAVGVVVATSSTSDPPPGTTGVTLQAVRGGLSW